MIHAAARGEPYACFVRPDTTIPFMAMPDAVDALLTLAAAPRERLTRTAYNVTRVQSVGGRDPRRRAAGVSAARDHVQGRRQAAGRSSTRGRRDVDDSARARPTGDFNAGVRFRPRLPRVPDPDDPRRYAETVRSRESRTRVMRP